MESFYGDSLFLLESALQEMLARIERIRHYCKAKGLHNPVEHYKGRIKSEESMIEKLERKGLEVNLENSLSVIHDAVGVRIVCNFVEDVYAVAKMFERMAGLEVMETKDYIAHPKPNGYRSYHMIVMLNIDMPGEVMRVPAEIQLRTIAQDSWAALEHKLKYKHNIKNVELIQKELKRCADEMASTDLSMQTVRQMINGEIQ